jgi:hypothetical protein
VVKNENSICETCNNKENCSHVAVINGPVVCCEEFDDYTPKPDFPAAVSEPLFQETHMSGKGYSEDVKGLCIDCDNSRSCRTARSSGGVWHCEEYK